MQPVLLIVLPLLAAFVSIMMKKELSVYLLLVVSIFNAASSFFFEQGIYLIGGFKSGFGISLVLDDYSLIAVQVINIAFLVLVVLSIANVKKLSTVLLISMAGLNGMLLTSDLFNLFVFLEVSSIAAYIITAQSKNLKATFNYLILGIFGSSLYLLGVVLVYKMTGFLDFYQVSLLSEGQAFFIPLLLIFVGFGVEAKLLPFSGWVKNILKGADKLSSVLIASIYGGAMLFVLGRLLMVFTLSPELKLLLTVIGLLTMILGETAAYSSSKLKEVLAFSSVGQAGLTLLLFIFNLYTLAVMQIIANVIVKLVLFAFASRLESDKLDELKGLFTNNKVVGVAVTVSLLSLLGVPFFMGFVIKLNVLFNLVLSKEYLVIIAILIVAIIEAGYIISILVSLWNSGCEGEVPNKETNTTVKLESDLVFKSVLVLATALIILLGLMPKYMYSYTSGSENRIIDTYPVEYIDEIGGVQ